MEAPSGIAVLSSAHSEIATEINSLHKQAMENVASAAEIAAEIGGRLIQIKEQLPHGQFQQWIAENCEFSYEQANRYVRVANMSRETLLPNCSIRKALAAIASDPDSDSSPSRAVKDKGDTQPAKRGRSWSEILTGYSKRKKVTFDELAASVGMKNAEKVRRYATQWEDASGLVIEKASDGISVKAGGDAIEAIFEALPSTSKQRVIQRLHMDEQVVEKKLQEFKRGNQTVFEHVSGVLYKANDLLHGVVQQYRNKEQALCRITEEQADDLIRIHSSIESLVLAIQGILIDGVRDGISKK